MLQWRDCMQQLRSNTAKNKINASWKKKTKIKRKMPILTDPDTQPLPWGGLTTLSALLMKPGPLGFLLPPLQASPLSSLQILIWEPTGATKPQPTNPTSSFSLEPRVHLVLPCLKAFSLPPLIVPSKGSGPAWPLECTPPNHYLAQYLE